MRFGLKFLAAFVATGSLLASANAAVISVNFQGDDPSGLLSTDSAGVVAATNWNNAAGASGGPTALHYSTGAASTVSLSSYAVTGLNSVVGSSATNATPQKAVFESGLSVNYGHATFSLTGLSAFQSYDLIVYYDAGSSFPTDRTATFSASGTSATTFYVAGSNTARTAYSLSNSTDSSIYKQGNYVQFSGLTDASQTITYTFKSSPTSLAGFQIVGVLVPEPSTLGVLAMGSVFLLRRRRKTC